MIKFAKPTRRKALGMLGLGAVMLGVDIAPGSALGQSDASDNVLTEGSVLRDPELPVAGNADGDITIVEYFDYNCPYCRKIAPELAQVVQDETDETGLPLSLSGPGLQDMLRLAGSPYSVWRDVAHTNTENITRALDRLGQAVEYLRTRLTSKELEQEFLVANELYKQLKKPE